MVNYNNGKIYMIEPTVEMIEEGDIYIGSTTEERLSTRISCHRSEYKRWKDWGRLRKITSFDLFDKYGVENCKITLLELCSCNTRDELISRESHHIRNTKCVNKCIPDRTKAEWVLENKEHTANYHKNYKVMLSLKEKIKIKCECGSTIIKHNTKMHQTSEKHKIYMDSVKSSPEQPVFDEV